ncbi:hypothetical protein ACFY5C_15260 [Streptomyces sp. NPDC012935]
MSGNRAVAYLKPGTVEVRTIDYPTLELQECRHGVIAASTC